MKKFISIIGVFIFLSTVSFSQTAKEWNKQGIDHFKKMEYKEAFDCFTKAIEQNKEYAEAYYNRANTWFQLPANAFPSHDGCADFKKAKSLGFKAADEKIASYGCK